MSFHIPSNFQGGFFGLLSQHLTMALVSVVIGVAFSLPIGFACVRWPRGYPPVLSVASLLYSIPSLAFFTILVNFTGLTERTVIIPLSIYTLATLIPNVVDGLRSVAPDVRQAATAMGFTGIRRMIQVDLPIALPSVIAGVRVATVSNISMVSVGALIGVGGFGGLFTYAQELNRSDLMVTGIVISVLMAFVLDAALVAAQWLLTPWARAAGRKS
jgi:osmoprotectant transport system permease protein